MEIIIIISLINFLGIILVVFFAVRASRRCYKIDQKITRRDREDQLRFMSLDKRIEVYQSAYTLVINLWHNQDDIGKNRLWHNARIWFYENCLYLDVMSKKELSNYLMCVNAINMFKIGSDEYIAQLKVVEKAKEKVLIYLTENVGTPRTKLEIEDFEENKINKPGIKYRTKI